MADTLDESRAAAEWAPGLREAMVKMIERVKSKTRFVPRLGAYNEGILPPPPGWKAETMTYALADQRPGADLSARNRRRHHCGQQALRPEEGEPWMSGETVENTGGSASAVSGVRALEAKDSHAAAMWASHYQAGHVPFRQDCETV